MQHEKKENGLAGGSEPLLPHLVPTEGLQVVQDLSDQSLTQLVDLR